MAASSDEILEALKKVKFPGFSRDIVSFGVVRGVAIADTRVVIGVVDAELVAALGVGEGAAAQAVEESDEEEGADEEKVGHERQAEDKQHVLRMH